MVTPLRLAFLLCFLLPPFAAAAPQLLLQLDKKEVQLGQAIHAELYGIDLPGKLMNVDLHALDNQFGVIVKETTDEGEDVRWPNHSVQSMLFTLYPRAQGTITLPQLRLGEVSSKPQSLLVSPGIITSANGNSTISRQITLSTQQPWERQQVIIDIAIDTSERFVTLQSDDLKIPGLDIYPIPASSETRLQQGIKHTLLHSGWIIFPLTAGRFNIDLPAIKYRKSGRTLRSYYFPIQQLNVRELPPYIPPTMPVGSLHIASSLDSNTALRPDQLHYWDITLSGNGVSPKWLPPISQQIPLREGIQFFPATSALAYSTDNHGLHSQQDFHVPFKATGNGVLHLPSLALQYFEPQSGKIIAITHSPTSAFILSQTWRACIGVFIGLFVLIGGRFVLTRLRRMIQRKRLYGSAIEHIKSASTANELRKALAIIGKAEGWPGNLTLQAWALHWQANKKWGLNGLTEQLSQACYGEQADIDLQALRSALLARLQTKHASSAPTNRRPSD